MIGFQFNEKGLCLNPVTETIYDDQNFFLCIAYAKKAGKWYNGYRYYLKAGKSGYLHFPNSNKGQRWFKTKRRCRQTVLEHLIKDIKKLNHENTYPVVFALREELKKTKHDILL